MGALVNGVTIFIMGAVGLGLKRGIPKRLADRLIQAVGLCVIGMGISGLVTGNNTLVLILSMLIGTLLGEGLDIDARVIRFVDRLEANLQKNSDQGLNLKQGFISATMIFCVGSMAIVGSLESGLLADHTTLYTKSLLDGITAMLLSSSLGLGVLLSGLAVFLFEGAITLLAIFLQPLLSDLVITEMVSVGSLLLVALGLNMIKVTDFKIMNFTPAIFMPIFLFMIPGL
ncbi:DUF554 domain-containing protein [Hutsoniella sourekii]